MTTLARRLGLSDAVVIGLGSMLGAGVFVVWGPAAAVAGNAPALFVALGLAALVAACNATGSARLAARYPESGGTYVYGRERLGPVAGYLAGWGFVVGKTASCAAMALTIGFYLWPGSARLIAVLAVATLTAVNLRGIGKTAVATKLLVAITLVVLGVVLVIALGAPDQPGAVAAGSFSWGKAFGAAGLLFFAFAGYARIATLGEEVVEPERTIPRAMPIALTIVVGIYLLIAWACVEILGMPRLAASSAPLAEVVRLSGYPALEPAIRIGAGIAVCGVLLSLIAGVGRTTLAMARRLDLPSGLARIHPRWRTPWLAELAIAGIVIAVVSLADVRHAIGFSSMTVLTYYAITNLSAWTLGGSRVVRSVAVIGLFGCIALAVTLPIASVIAGTAVLVIGLVARLVARRRISD